MKGKRYGPAKVLTGAAMAAVLFAAAASCGARPHDHVWTDVVQAVHHDAEYETVTHPEEVIHHEAERKTVHHEAEHRTVHHEAVTEEVKVVDEPARDEKVLVKEAWDEQVLVKAAWDEVIEETAEVEKFRCRCGAIFGTLSEWEAHCRSFWDTEDEAAHSSYGTKRVTEVTGTRTVHHDAEYKTVHHEAEYETVHHEEKSHTDTRTTPAWDEKVLVKEAWDEEVLVRDAWDETMPAWEEQVLIKEAWDEEIVTGRKCSICGQTETYDGTEDRQRP